MGGFVRRYSSPPGTDTISLIEGVVIIDQAPPGSISGVGVGTVAVVGEFADVTYGVSVSTSGVVTGSPQPVEAFSSKDMIDKTGGFDETLGDFGGSMGNAYVALKSKRFSRLVLVPINIASSNGVRQTRKLPTNKGATNPVPAVPMQAASVAAGRQFQQGGILVKSAARAVFKDTAAYLSGVDGVWATAGSAVDQVFTAASGNFVNGGVKVGDVIVIGVIGAGGVQGSMADTYRVKAINSATSLQLEKLNGTAFASSSGTSIAWRLHEAACADTGGNNAFSAAAGYTIPARPLTDNTGSTSGSTPIAAGTLLDPTVAPPAVTATSWDPLSGLGMIVMPGGGGGLAYTAAVQGANPVSSGSLDALYTAAIDSLITEDSPGRDVNIVVAARKSSTIRSYLKGHVLAASYQGLGRIAVISPDLAQQSINTIVGTSDPGVGANRDERVIYAWPGAKTFVPEAVNLSIKTADGKTTTDGILDTPFDMWVASVLSVLPPERNPGEATPTTASVLSGILGFQRGVSGLGMNEYVSLKQNGVCGLRMDRDAGAIIQSGITTSLTSGMKNIARRRMADYIQDSMARRFLSFSKLPLTKQLKDTIVSEAFAFLNDLLSPNNPAAQRIKGFDLDAKSGNTDDLEAKGIFVLIVSVRTLASADDIVLQTNIGEGVVVTKSL